MAFFDRFYDFSWGGTRVLTKMTHFSGDFQYEIAINFQKSIRKGVRLEHFDRFLMIFNENDHFGIVNTQIYHIYLALAMFGLCKFYEQ